MDFRELCASTPLHLEGIILLLTTQHLSEPSSYLLLLRNKFCTENIFKLMKTTINHFSILRSLEIE